MLIDEHLNRTLNLLREKMRDQGFTQLEVQEELSWGRSYISQLMNRQKSLRLEQLHMILHVIGVSPEDFFIELYRLPRRETSPSTASPQAVTQQVDPAVARQFLEDSTAPQRLTTPNSEQTEEIRRSVDHVGSLTQAIAQLLIEKELLSLDELSEVSRTALERRTKQE